MREEDRLRAENARLWALVETLQRAVDALARAGSSGEPPEGAEARGGPRAWRERTKPAVPEGCAVEGCDRPYRAHGFCAKHYQRWKRGTLEAVGESGRE
jgi:hypothetical protein